MSSIVVYGSLHGAAQRYAEELARVFHLRGGIDYEELNCKHKTMMGLLYRKAKSLPEAKQTADSKAMVETYGQKVDFVDFSSLDPIVEVAAALSE